MKGNRLNVTFQPKIALQGCRDPLINGGAGGEVPCRSARCPRTFLSPKAGQRPARQIMSGYQMRELKNWKNWMDWDPLRVPLLKAKRNSRVNCLTYRNPSCYYNKGFGGEIPVPVSAHSSEDRASVF